MRKLPIISLVYLFSLPCLGQTPENDLRFYADVFSNAYEAEHRLRALDSFNAGLDRLLDEESSFTRNLSFLPWLGLVYSPDSTFRILTWQVEKKPGQYIYYGRFQMADGSIVKLLDRAPKQQPLEYESLDPKEWYGAKYYQIAPAGRDSTGSDYLLLGYDAWSETDRRRIADILQIRNGRISFGKPVLIDGDGDDAPQSRLIVEYSATSRFVMRYDKDSNMLVFDHLIPVRNPVTGKGVSMVPDGSYVGFTFKDGLWVKMDKVYDRILDAPPVNKPASDENRDLFGRETGKKDQ